MCWYTHTHLNNDKLSSTVHFTRLSLPNSSRCRVHASTKASHDTPDHHTSYSPTTCLDDCANPDDRRTEQNLFWASENVASPDSTHCSDEASNVVYGGHHTLHVGGGIAKCVKEVLRNDDIAEDTLVVTVETAGR